MRILHTADWHIGQKLHERDRQEEHRQFLAWLFETIQTREIDLLLVSGDIFHTALPSGDATTLYYEFLSRISKETDASVAITAGNHDSARRLEAPSEFLAIGRIHVVGLAETPEACVLALPTDDPKIAIGAVPYFSEDRLPHVSYESDIDRNERYRERLKVFYEACIAAMPPELPKILMGHLFVQGGEVGDSERNIQVGGAMLFRAEDFPADVDYVALGHLHRPQSINRPQSIKGQPYLIRYSGSPIPLRFGEEKHQKSVYLIEMDDNGALVSDETIGIQTFKEFRTVEGDENFALSEALTGTWDGVYIQVKLKLDAPSVGINDRIRQAFHDRGGDVLTVEIELPEAGSRPQISVEAMKHPQEIFRQFHESKYDGTPPDETLLETFGELLQTVENTQSIGD